MRTTTAGRGVAFSALSVPIAWGVLVAVATAKADETECLRCVGPAYRAYMTSTKRFVPFAF